MEDEIIAALPATVKDGEQVYTPYLWPPFDIATDGTAATETNVSLQARGCTQQRNSLTTAAATSAADLDNLTITDPSVNRAKGIREAAQWTQARHRAWFAEQVIAAKPEYGLTVDPAEPDALKMLLASVAELNCVDADTIAPAVTISATADEPVTRPFPITVAFSEPVTSFELENLAFTNGSASDPLRKEASYTAAITPAASGPVTVDIAAGARAGQRCNASAGRRPVLDPADLAPGLARTAKDLPAVRPVQDAHFQSRRRY